MSNQNIETNTDFEVRSLDAICVNDEEIKTPSWHNLKYLLFGILFGVVLIKAEVVSWYRIQEMFRLQSFHMYGIIGSAVIAGIFIVQLIKRRSIKNKRHCLY